MLLLEELNFMFKAVKWFLSSLYPPTLILFAFKGGGIQAPALGSWRLTFPLKDRVTQYNGSYGAIIWRGYPVHSNPLWWLNWNPGGYCWRRICRRSYAATLQKKKRKVKLAFFYISFDLLIQSDCRKMSFFVMIGTKWLSPAFLWQTGLVTKSEVQRIRTNHAAGKDFSVTRWNKKKILASCEKKPNPLLLEMRLSFLQGKAVLLSYNTANKERSASWLGIKMKIRNFCSKNGLL